MSCGGFQKPPFNFPKKSFHKSRRPRRIYGRNRKGEGVRFADLPGENNMRGKEKCRMLKQIRKRIADENDIPFVVEECEHKGECKGTCPKCEAELRELERELSIRHRLGKAVAVAGVAAGLMATTTACTIEDVTEVIEYFANRGSGGEELMGILPQYRQLQGDIALPPDDGGRQTEGEARPADYEGGLEAKAIDDVDLGFLDEIAGEADDEAK